MFGGLFASFFFEMVFLCVFRFAPYSLFASASRFALWFALFPFATFGFQAQDDEITWLGDYKEAIRQARQTHKPIFIEFRCEA